jgi:hypothetical protein
MTLYYYSEGTGIDRWLINVFQYSISTTPDAPVVASVVSVRDSGSRYLLFEQQSRVWPTNNWYTILKHSGYKPFAGTKAFRNYQITADDLLGSVISLRSASRWRVKNASIWSQCWLPVLVHGQVPPVALGRYFEWVIISFVLPLLPY